MDTILEQLRKTNTNQHVSEEEKAGPDKGNESSGAPALKGRYRCRVCGYIFDEAEEGEPFSTLTECPLCHVSSGGLQQIR